MDRYLERLDDIESYSWVDRSRAARKRAFDLLVIVSISLSLLVVLLPAIDIIVEDPNTRWAALILIVVAMAILVLRQVALAEPPGPSLTAKKRMKGSRGPLERLKESIDSASGGSSYGQMLSMLELRSAFRGKIMVMRGYTREELNTLINDRSALHRVIRDEQLEQLLNIDLKKTYMVKDGNHGGGEFWQMINKLTDKVEDWR
ncbi:MAG: hypothetical protein GKC03_06175 [Methanomassiliicoccales archaeon]|nr:hypothetical protein [Methanomassiliicoccales archaeon]NYT15286.1 hypothetical protein [Methanomassiliicoccales archaeon]